MKWRYEYMDSAMKYWVYDSQDRLFGSTTDKDTARRIVAAVNACEGIETEHLEGAELEKICQDRMWQIKENEKLQAQNARLLGALKALCDEFGADENTRSEAEAIYQAREAIAESTTPTPPKPDESDSFMQRFNSPESGQRLDNMIKKVDAILSRLNSKETP